MAARTGVRFSKAERLIGAALCVLVLSVVAPWWVAHRGQARLERTAADLQLFVDVAEQFFVEYGYWPSPHMGTPDDMRYGRETRNDLVLNILRAVDGPGNEGHRVNPNRIVYLELPARRPGRSGVRDDGVWVDVWGSPYQLVLDTDMDNECTIAHSMYPNQPDRGVVAWSYGPDRTPDTRRDVLSWNLD
jgi:type II secretory pathway pseudopilin PulG